MLCPTVFSISIGMETAIDEAMFYFIPVAKNKNQKFYWYFNGRCIRFFYHFPELNFFFKEW